MVAPHEYIEPTQPAIPPTRDERLVELQTTFDRWAAREEAILNNEADFLQSVIDERGTVGVTAKGNLRASTLSVVSSIQDFLSK